LNFFRLTLSISSADPDCFSYPFQVRAPYGPGFLSPLPENTIDFGGIFSDSIISVAFVSEGVLKQLKQLLFDFTVGQAAFKVLFTPGFNPFRGCKISVDRKDISLVRILGILRVL
jgi:hypothetical protein